MSYAGDHNMTNWSFGCSLVVSLILGWLPQCNVSGAQEQVFTFSRPVFVDILDILTWLALSDVAFVANLRTFKC